MFLSNENYILCCLIITNHIIKSPEPMQLIWGENVGYCSWVGGPLYGCKVNKVGYKDEFYLYLYTTIDQCYRKLILSEIW